MPIWRTKSANRAVGYWVLTGTVMLCIQVLLGGITRLTGSGLSITEWNVITGVLPPLNAEQWAVKFNMYKQTPQFHLLNADFTMGDFKFIFFWEWFHRLWARLVGVVFHNRIYLAAIQEKMKSEMIMPLLILFFLGLLQAADWMDHGSQRFDRRCAVCEAYPACSAFYFCTGSDFICILVFTEIIISRMRASGMREASEDFPSLCWCWFLFNYYMVP